jgi:serine/threonine protein kinase/O-acetyl-ADP-ribose deacetylase (regulator of RNase III)
MSELGPDDLLFIDAIGEEFEDRWRRGERPSLAEAVDDAPAPLRPELRRHLLGLDCDLRRECGECPAIEDYEGLGPEWSGVVFLVLGPEAPTEAARPPADLAHEVTLPQLDDFKVLDCIAKGGMGLVFKAWQVSLERLVALKTLAPGASSKRFLREARLIAGIASPHVVAVHDLRLVPGGGHVLVMDYIEGTNLAEVIRSRGGQPRERLSTHNGRAKAGVSARPPAQPIDEVEVLPWMRHVALGMMAAAERNIIHRDLKPSNILINKQGRALVADFGLGRGPASIVDDLTRSDEVLGTSHYMAPEQAEDPQGVDVRADIYSFGATFYHALTGAPPFDGKTVYQIFFKHKTEPLRSPRARNPALSEWLSDLLERCLAKAPSDRFPSFAEVYAQLLAGPGAPSPWQVTDDPVLAQYLERFRSRRAAYLEGPPAQGVCDVFKFPGGRTIKVVRDDLTEQRVDALVNSETSMLTMTGGLSLALRLKGGEALAGLAQAYRPVRPGRVVVTTAGRLSARFLFHAVTSGLQDGEWIMPGHDLITDLVSNCFHHAESLNVRTIAFPLLGTGGGGLERDRCLDALFRAIARTFHHGLTCVQEARIIILPRGAL